MDIQKKHQPLVTIVTPCYNHEKWLTEYFQGLLNQTYRNLEIILFDDGSTDRSWEIIQSHEPKLKEVFPRIVCARHKNMGLIRELDLAMKEVTGDFLCFIASDDYYLPSAIEELSTYLAQHPKCGVVHADTDYLYPDRVEHAHWKSIGRTIPQGDVSSELLKTNFIMACATCLRTNLVKKYVNFSDYAKRKYLMEDYPMYLTLSCHTQFGYLDKPLARYRVLAESASHSRSPQRQLKFDLSGHRIHLDFLLTCGASEEEIFKTQLILSKAAYYKGYELGLKQECWEGYRWLVQTYPAEYKTFWHYARVIAVQNKFLWRVNNWLQEAAPLTRIKRLLGLGLNR